MPCIAIEAKWCPVAFPGQVTSNYDQVLRFPQNRRQSEELCRLPRAAVCGEEPGTARKEKCEGKAILTTTTKCSFDMTQCLEVLGNIHSYVQKHLARGILFF